MNRITNIWATILSIFILTQSAVVTAENIKYTGTIYATSIQTLMPLGNGDGVVLSEVAGVSASHRLLAKTRIRSPMARYCLLGRSSESALLCDVGFWPILLTQLPSMRT